MDSPTLKKVMVPGDVNDPTGPSLQSIVRKSALLNLAIVLTSCPVLLFVGGPKAAVPTLAIMAGISILVWSATFALFSFVSLVRIFWTPDPSVKRGGSHPPAEGVSDHWLDGPV